MKRFSDIDAARQVRLAISTAIRVNGPVRIIGAPGTGKSFALKHFAPEFDATYCEASGDRKGLKGLAHTLTEAYRVHSDARFVGELWDVLLQRIGVPSLTDGPLIVDEWQTLEPPAQRELLRLAERCEIPLVLSGNAERLYSSRTHKAALAQIENRIIVDFQTQTLSAEDCASISIDHNVEGADAREFVARFGLALGLRKLAHLLEEAIALTGGVGSIQRRHLEVATMNLGKSPAALEQLQ